MPLPKLPPNSEPKIVKMGWPPMLCIAVGLLCLLLIVVVILNMGG